MDSFFYLVVLAGALAGASTGLLGVFMVGMRIPLIGPCIAHAAMAGAVYGSLLGLNPLAGAVLASVMTGAVLSLIRPGRLQLDTNVGLAILFFLLLGLTFLGIGLIPGSRTEVLGLLWGSLLFVRSGTVMIILGVSLLLVLFVWLFNKELKTILFSRSMAAMTGVHEGLIYLVLLCLSGAILAVNIRLVGGLMIFSLITNPAAAAYQLCRGYRAVVICSILLGILSAVGGFGISFYLNLPTGACIVIFSTIIFAISAGCRFLFER